MVVRGVEFVFLFLFVLVFLFVLGSSSNSAAAGVPSRRFFRSIVALIPILISIPILILTLKPRVSKQRLTSRHANMSRIPIPPLPLSQVV